MLAFRSLPLQLALSGSLVQAISVTSSRAMSTSAARRSKIAVAQLCSTASKLDSLLSVAKCAGWAKREGCSMLFLPENCGFLGESLEQTLEQAEPLLTEQTPGNDPFVIKALEETVDECAGETRGEQADSDLSKKTIVLLEGLQTVARKANMWMSAGIHVAGAPPLQAAMNGSENPRIYNTQVILDNEGNLQCYYRKIHLFDISIPGKVNLRESATTAPGTELVICDSPIGRLGLSTCYDVRFPEMYVQLVKKGAQILLVPSAFTVPTGSAHWHTLLQARAIESQCYVVAAAQFGRHNAQRESYGHSLVVDPWGKIVADAGGVDGPGTLEAVTTPSIITCDIDLDKIDSVRENMPMRLHRENASYS